MPSKKYDYHVSVEKLAWRPKFFNCWKQVKNSQNHIKESRNSNSMFVRMALILSLECEGETWGAKKEKQNNFCFFILFCSCLLELDNKFSIAKIFIICLSAVYKFNARLFIWTEDWVFCLFKIIFKISKLNSVIGFGWWVFCSINSEGSSIQWKPKKILIKCSNGPKMTVFCGISDKRMKTWISSHSLISSHIENYQKNN